MILRIQTPYALFGVQLDPLTRIVTKCHPTVRYMLGWLRLEVLQHCADRGWLCDELTDEMVILRRRPRRTPSGYNNH